MPITLKNISPSEILASFTLCIIGSEDAMGFEEATEEHPPTVVAVDTADYLEVDGQEGCCLRSLELGVVCPFAVESLYRVL